MRSKINIPFCCNRFWVRVSRILFVATVVFGLSYCTQRDKDTSSTSLTEDESYLVDAYMQVAHAREIRDVSYVKSESLFTMLDSVLDSTRIAHTVESLNRDPDRWLLVFRSIERKLLAPPQEGGSEEAR